MREAGWKLGPLLVGILFVGLALRPSGEDVANHPSLERDVLPLLKVRCLKCHGPIKPKGKLNLSGPRSLARGGSNGPVVIPGNLEESIVWDLVSQDKMPPKSEEPLSSDEKALADRPSLVGQSAYTRKPAKQRSYQQALSPVSLSTACNFERQKCPPVSRHERSQKGLRLGFLASMRQRPVKICGQSCCPQRATYARQHLREQHLDSVFGTSSVLVPIYQHHT